MAKRTKPERTSRREREQDRAAWKDAVPVGAVYAGAVVAMLLTEGRGPSTAHLISAFLYLAGAGLLVRAEVRGLRRADEFQRSLQLEALAIGFAAVMVLLVVGGLLAGLGVAEPGPWLPASLVGGVLAWLGTRALLTWRSR